MEIRADMVYFNIGRDAVFSVGPIDGTASLAYNYYENNVVQITRNGLCRFTSEPLTTKIRSADDRQGPHGDLTSPGMGRRSGYLAAGMPQADVR